MQAKRQDNLTGGHKQIWGGTKSSLLRIRESGPKNKGLYPEFPRGLGWRLNKKKKRGLYLKKYTNIHDFWDKTAKKGSLMQNLQKTVLAHKFLDNNQYYGVSGLKLLSSGTEPVNLFGAQSLLEGEQFSFWGGISSDLGGDTAPECPPWQRTCHNVMIVLEVCVHNTAKLLKHANVNFVSDPGVRPIVLIFLSPLSTACWVIYAFFQIIAFFHFQYTICKHKSVMLTLERQLYTMSTKCQQKCNYECVFRSTDKG